jgi:hypothetical protein
LVVIVALSSVEAKRAHTLSEIRTQGLLDKLGNIVQKVLPSLSLRMPRHLDLTKINALNCIRFSNVANLITRLKNKGAGWEAGHNDFSCWNQDDLKQMTGAILEPPPRQPGAIAVEGEAVHVLSADDLAAIPANFDSQTYWPGCVSDVQHQGTCGSCWAFSCVTYFIF